MVAISSPDKEIGGFHMDDGGYLRHEVIKKDTLKDSAQAAFTSLSSIAAEVVQPPITPAKVENLRESVLSATFTPINKKRASTAPDMIVHDSAFGRGGVFDPKEIDMESLALATVKRVADDMLDMSEAIEARVNVPPKGPGKKNQKNISIDGEIGTNFVDVRDQRGAKQRRKQSVAADLSNIFTPMVRTLHSTQKNYSGRGKYRCKLKGDTADEGARGHIVVDENTDPIEKTFHSTQLQSSRRRSYKARSSLAALTPPSMQVSTSSTRDPVLGMTDKTHPSDVRVVGKEQQLKKKTQQNSPILTISSKEEIVDSNKTAEIACVKSTKKDLLKARMRGFATFPICEEDEEPSVSQKYLVDNSKEIFTDPIRKIEEDPTSRVDKTNTDLAYVDIEIPYSPKYDIEKVLKYAPKTSAREIEDNAPSTIVASSKMINSNSTTSIDSWRASAVLINAKSSSPEPSSNRDESIVKLNDKIRAIIQSPVQIELDSHQGESSKITNKKKTRADDGITMKGLQLPIMLSSSQRSNDSKSQEDSDSNYIKPVNRNEKTLKGRSRGKEQEQDSSSEGEEPSSDEDGVIAM